MLAYSTTMGKLRLQRTGLIRVLVAVAFVTAVVLPHFSAAMASIQSHHHNALYASEVNHQTDLGDSSDVGVEIGQILTVSQDGQSGSGSNDCCTTTCSPTLLPSNSTKSAFLGRTKVGPNPVLFPPDRPKLPLERPPRF